MIINDNVWDSLERQVGARVELYNGSTLTNTIEHTDSLIGLEIERNGEKGKHFGFGISQKVKVNFLDRDKVLEINKSNKIKINFKTNANYFSSFPYFFVEETKRDENTNNLEVVAYDALFAATAHTVEELGLVPPYTISDVATACANLLGISSIKIVGVYDDINPFYLNYNDGANFDGAETIREVLNFIADASQTIYFINNEETLVFKRLDINGQEQMVIDKKDYFTLESKEDVTLAAICSATELGDNIELGVDGLQGITHYVRDNAFWELRDDIPYLLNNALANVGGLTIGQFNCGWRGNPALELGDKIVLVGKDNNLILSYLLDDKLTYNGGFKMVTSWSWEDNKAETASNPTTLGAALKKTFARVDKANKEIELVAGETAAIKLTTDAITSTVTKLDDDMADMASQVSTKVSSDSVSFAIETAMAEGVEKVTTTTGFTFNEEGLHISKSDSEITTSITEDGMTVYKNDDAVLVADNEGVKAEDLHATTYLIVGNNSRFEDFGADRTGCFWIR